MLAMGSFSSIFLTLTLLMSANALESGSLLRKEESSGDAGSLLELKDIDSIMDDAGISHSDLKLHAFDGNGDGRLSEKEFRAAIPEAKRKGVADKLAKLLEAHKNKDVADRQVFKAADVDHSSFLEENEIENLLAHTDINRAAFNWHDHDRDNDNRLSEREFLDAGRAAAKAIAAPRVASLSEMDADSEIEEKRREMNRQMSDQKVFKKADANGDGYLESGEMKALMTNSGIDSFQWQAYDFDGDGRLSEHEFVAAGPAVAMHYGQFKQEAHPLFQKIDADQSSFLEAKEMEDWHNNANVHPQPPSSKYFNWRDFDTDQDGRLSEDEFIKAGHAAANAILLQQQDESAKDSDKDADEKDTEYGYKEYEKQKKTMMVKDDGKDDEDDKDDDDDEDDHTGKGSDSESLTDLQKDDSSDDSDDQGEKDSKPGKHKKRVTDSSVTVDGHAKVKRAHGHSAAETEFDSDTKESASQQAKEGLSAEIEERFNVPDAEQPSDDMFVLNMYDTDHDGQLSYKELKTLVKDAGTGGKDLATEAQLKVFDANGDGKLNFKEFINSAHVLKARTSEAFREKVVRMMSDKHEAKKYSVNGFYGGYRKGDSVPGGSSMMQSNQHHGQVRRHHQNVEDTDQDGDSQDSEEDPAKDHAHDPKAKSEDAKVLDADALDSQDYAARGSSHDSSDDDSSDDQN